jgi:hypothetical protein
MAVVVLCKQYYALISNLSQQVIHEISGLNEQTMKNTGEAIEACPKDATQ